MVSQALKRQRLDNEEGTGNTVRKSALTHDLIDEVSFFD
jgi:hypothetical protein